MTITFEPTKNRGRHIYSVYGMLALYFLADGTEATETQADAIAQGYIEGRRQILGIQLASIETISDTPRAIGNAYSKWAANAAPEIYGARAPYYDYEIKRPTTIHNATSNP